MPAAYNNNIQLLQTPTTVVIFTEMIHDARIVTLDGRPHIDDSIRQWRGVSRAEWDGDTLVVDTTNFSEQAEFRGSNGNLHLVERFALSGSDTLTLRVHGHGPDDLDESLDSHVSTHANPGTGL